MKKINNDYDSLAHLWWSEEEGDCASIRYLVNPVRFAYFQKVIKRHYINGYQNKTVLDVGCGGGLLAEELCKFGLCVTGVDPSIESIHIAEQHAKDNQLHINYQMAYGEKLPFDDNIFDMVFCCDVLEHVNDVNSVVTEISRVLKNGGIFFYDTINRTVMSRIAVIYFTQQCKYTSFGRPDGHVWDMFIKPQELQSIMGQCSISNMEIKGISPKNKKLSHIIDLYKAAQKNISYKELARRMQFDESNGLNCSYMGYGIKTANPRLPNSV